MTESLRPASSLKPGVALDVTLAGEVQRLLFPKSSPVCSWCRMGFKNHMASVLGGDFYDFIELEDGCQVVLIGDVTGHGLHASVVMALVYGYLHRALAASCDPLLTVTQLNRFLRSFARRSERLDHFFSATLFLGMIEPGARQMHYVNAGHPAGLVRRCGEILELAPTGQPVGYFDQPELQAGWFQFERGDRFVLYTDGLVDGLDARGEVFGASRLKALSLACDHDHLQFLGEIFKAFYAHLGGQSPVDDCTAIVIDFHGGFA